MTELTDLHTEMIRDVKFSPDVLDSTYVFASCSEDTNLKVVGLNIENKDTNIVPIATKSAGAPIWRLAWSDTGRVVSGVYLAEDKSSSTISLVKKRSI